MVSTGADPTGSDNADHLTFSLTPDPPEAEHLTPKIRPSFSNYLRDTTLEAISQKKDFGFNPPQADLR
jgi:hypothetical protein